MDDEATPEAPFWRGMRMEYEAIARFAVAARPAFLAGIVLIAFVTQPLLRFADLYSAYAGTAVFVVGMILASTALKIERRWPGVLVGAAAMIYGSVILGNVIDDAAKLSAINDRRCLMVEEAILTGKSKRADLPDLFTAFSCRPQTNLVARI